MEEVICTRSKIRICPHIFSPKLLFLLISVCLLSQLWARYYFPSVSQMLLMTVHIWKALECNTLSTALCPPGVSIISPVMYPSSFSILYKSAEVFSFTFSPHMLAMPLFKRLDSIQASLNEHNLPMQKYVHNYVIPGLSPATLLKMSYHGLRR